MVWAGEGQREDVLAADAARGQRPAAVGLAGVFAAVFHHLDEHDALGEGGGGLDGLCQAGLPALLDLDAVDHDLDGVLELLVKLHAV